MNDNMTREKAIAFFKDMNECTYGNLEAVEMAIKALEQESKTGHWTIKQYQVPIKTKQLPTVSGITFTTVPTACKIVYTYTHSDCKSEEYLNKYNYCPNCGAKMKGEV